MDMPKTMDAAHIGSSVVIKGELSGSEDLYIDGQVEGNIELKGNRLTIGPNGKIRADVSAKNVVVHGKLEGNVQASERVELKNSAVAVGDIFAQKISIEDGAYFKGKVDIQKLEASKAGLPAPEKTSAAVASESGSAKSAAATSAGGTLATANKTQVTEPGKI